MKNLLFKTRLLLISCLSLIAELTPASNYVINNSKMSVTISATGEISSIATKNGTLITPITLNSGLEGCTLSGSIIVRENSDGSIEFEKLLVNDSLNTTCTLIQRYYPTSTSIRCDLSIRGGGNSWSNSRDRRNARVASSTFPRSS